MILNYVLAIREKALLSCVILCTFVNKLLLFLLMMTQNYPSILVMNLRNNYMISFLVILHSWVVFFRMVNNEFLRVMK